MHVFVKIKCSPWVGKLMEHKSHGNVYNLLIALFTPENGAEISLEQGM